MIMTVEKRTASVITLIYWLFAISCSARNHRHFAKRNLDTITKIYERNVYPNNLEFLANGSKSVPPGLFNANAKGRITPVGNFTGFEESTEYFFALSPIPTPPDYQAWDKAQITHFSSACPEVASSVVVFRETVQHPGAPDDGKYISSIKQVAFWKFDDTGAVLEYDAWIPTLRLYENTSTPNPPSHQDTILVTCATVQTLCTGPNTQYESTEACSKFFSSIPFGDVDNLWSNSVSCRQVHLLLARIRPDIHCPHVGPTGGGKCVDVNYNEEYFDDQALFGDPVGETFVCK